VEFHVHTNASLLVVGGMLSHKVTWKSDQLIVYTYRFLNIIKQNNNTTEREALVMVFVLHKFKHYLLGNKFIFYVDHMALVYLVIKPQVSRIITRWLLLFLEYDFTIVYKTSIIHIVTYALSRLLAFIEPTCVLDQTTDASLFYTEP
jgi:hypothetical protein